MALRQAVHVVRLVALQHVGLQQRVVAHAAQRDAVVGEHVHVVLHVLPDLGAGRILQPGLQARQRGIEGQLLRRAGVAVRQRQVGGAVRPRRRARCRPAARPADRGWWSRCRRRSALRGDACQPGFQLRLSQDRFVLALGVRRRPAAGPRRARAASPGTRGARTAAPGAACRAAYARGPRRRRAAARSHLTVSSSRAVGSQSRALRRFSPTTPPISSACASRSVRAYRYCCSHLAAVFGPTLSTPGMLSTLSPISVR